jgi:hypothetical protein
MFWIWPSAFASASELVSISADTRACFPRDRLVLRCLFSTFVLIIGRDKEELCADSMLSSFSLLKTPWTARIYFSISNCPLGIYTVPA